MVTAAALLAASAAGRARLPRKPAIQRDNGGCPGTIGASTCSGVAQNSWDFSHLLGHVTR
jgi:hypothetical protein